MGNEAEEKMMMMWVAFSCRDQGRHTYSMGPGLIDKPNFIPRHPTLAPHFFSF